MDLALCASVRRGFPRNRIFLGGRLNHLAGAAVRGGLRCEFSHRAFRLDMGFASARK